MDETDEKKFYQRSRTDKSYVGPSIPDFKGRRLRIGNKYIDAGPGNAFCDVKEEVILRNSPGGRVHIKATFMEDDRAFQTLERFSSVLNRYGFPNKRVSDSCFLPGAGGRHGWDSRFQWICASV